MSQLLQQAGQFVVTTAQQVGPDVARFAANQAAASALTYAQNLIFGPVKRRSQGPRREEIRIQTASEGVGVPRVYGRQRIAGEIIWATGFKETTEVTRTRVGGKGARRSVEQEQTTYQYSVSLAIGLCEGPIARIGRVWADGVPISLQDYTTRLYHGTEDQLPDSLIEAEEGVTNAPAFRGLAYIVFEDLPLAAFGNRMPQLNFEVECLLPSQQADSLEEVAKAVTLIPGSGESVYHTEPVLTEVAEGVTRAENVYNNVGGTDLQASLDHLTAIMPNVEAVELVVSWFGSDLRADQCQVIPKVEVREKVSLPDEWSVAGISRAAAQEVSTLPNGSPAYGGTPSDEGVRQTIADLKARGQSVIFYPFLLMDIPPGNSLPDPLEGSTQGAYPWRGRITCSPRDSVDGTGAARTQVNQFFSQYRTMILHYAQLCVDAGGVEAFLIGSELRGLTNIRDQQNRFPAVEKLISLAADVRAILGPSVKLSYAADWSEYHSYQPTDGSGDLFFHLDDLWADQNIDFIGVDNYMPVTDWRDGLSHLDAENGALSIYDEDYLAQGIRGGENYDWFYASVADREAQIRTPISDGVYGEDWVYRSKDFWSWWSLPHTNRVGGAKDTLPTAWVPEEKPIWLTELGCAATNKASNQPNVFYDPKSAENGFPYFSNGDRDDMIQRRFLEAHHRFWSEEENNPISSVYDGSMIDPTRIFLYTWDARPFPDFPVRGDVWADSDNWVYGHWLNGRVGRIPLGELIEKIAADTGLLSVDASACQSLVTGYALPGPMAARDALEPLFDLYQLDAVERAGVLVVTPRTGRITEALAYADLIDLDEPVQLTRAQAEDLPAALSVTYTDGLSEYQSAVVETRDPSAMDQGAVRLDTAIVLEAGEAEGRAAALLAEARAMRTQASFALPTGAGAREVGDVITLDLDDSSHTLRLTSITDGLYQEIESISTDPSLYQPRYTGLSGQVAAAPLTPGPVLIEVMDLPLLPDGQDTPELRVAAFADPWPGGVSVYRGDDDVPTLLGQMTSLSLMGRLEAALPDGPTSRWDEGTRIRLRLSAGGLSSLSRTSVLEGEGRLAVQSTLGSWELIAYTNAILEPDGSWTLSGLLRGLRGTEDETAAGAELGARIVILDDGQVRSPIATDSFGLTETWQAGPATREPGAFPYRSFDVDIVGTGARPFAPVHLRTEVSGTTATFTWIRRGRIGGDNWSLTDIPLSETQEQYQVTAYDAGNAILSQDVVTSPTHTLDITTATRIEVAQISDRFGPGRAAAIAL